MCREIYECNYSTEEISAALVSKYAASLDAARDLQEVQQLVEKMNADSYMREAQIRSLAIHAMSEVATASIA